VSDGAESARPPVALILVRNTVSHDARVMREAETLRGLGYQVLVAGVVSSAEAERRVSLEGTAVVRLAPGAGLRRTLARRQDAAAPDPAPMEILGHIRPKSPSRAFGGRVRRLALAFAYYAGGIRLALRVRPALLHANDYNTMWIGVVVKLLLGTPVVYDCHELWPDRNGRPEWRAWLIACEALFVRLADVTITASPGYARAIAARYRVAPPRVVRNIPRLPVTTAGRNGRRSPPVAVYLGGVMPGRGLEQAIQALRLAPQVSMRVVGPGRAPYVASLERMARDAGVEDRLEIREAVPLSEALESIAECEMGLMLIQPVCRSYELTLPNKLFEYAAAGLPILASDLPVIGEVVRSEGIGEVVPAEDVEQIARAMERVADHDVNAKLRQRVVAFAERETWERERAVLAGAYTVASGRR
jgi:glycosyltransferase involved in cell wall biosynthesis